jgi:molecular chaperone GrpE
LDAGENDPKTREMAKVNKKVAKLEEKLEQATEESKNNYDKFLRASAELDNYRKRTSREMEEMRKYATQSLLKDLLLVADSLDLAIKSAAESKNIDSCLVDGIDLTRKELMKAFDRYNVTSIEALGNPFDPNYHEAVMREESDIHPENTVTNELQKGYLIHERLLRPSMVVVSMPKANTAETDDESPKSEE